MMGWPDYILLGLIAVSTLVGLLRGFIKEAFSLVVWIAAFWVAYTFTDQITLYLEPGISLPSARTAVGFAGLFILTLLVGGLLTYLVGLLVEKTGLSGTDRLIGAVFGAFRGLILVIAIIILAGFTPIPRDPWWQETPTIQRLVPLADWAASLLPESVRKFLDEGVEADRFLNEEAEAENNEQEPEQNEEEPTASEIRDI